MSAEQKIPKGSRAAGRRARLPRGAQEPIRVYINGVEQPRGEMWDVHGDEIVFTRQIIKEEVTTGRWLAMYIGVFGTYRLNEIVDVEYTTNGRATVASDVEIYE